MLAGLKRKARVGGSGKEVTKNDILVKSMTTMTFEWSELVVWETRVGSSRTAQITQKRAAWPSYTFRKISPCDKRSERLVGEITNKLGLALCSSELRVLMAGSGLA